MTGVCVGQVWVHEKGDRLVVLSVHGGIVVMQDEFHGCRRRTTAAALRRHYRLLHGPRNGASAS